MTHKHVILGILFIVSFLPVSFGASLGTCSAYINVTASEGMKIEVVGNTDKTRSVEVGSIGKDHKKRDILRFRYKSKTPYEWTDTSFKFKVTCSGEIIFRLSAPEKNSKDKQILPVAVYYDDVKLNGELLPNGDFSNDFSTWEESIYGNSGIVPKIVKNSDIIKDGNCVRVTRTSQLSKVIKVQSGQVYEISFSTRSGGLIDKYSDDIQLDFSKYYNNSSVNMARVNVPLPDPKISQDGVIFNDIKFKAKTRVGRSAVFIRNKLLPYVEPKVEFKLTEEQAKSRYLYVIHTISSANKMKDGVGRILFTTKSGKLIKNDVYLNRDCGFQDEVAKGMNAKAYQVDGGTVYFSRFKMPENDLVDTVSFKTFYKSPWVIYAATFSDRHVYPFEVLTPTTENWTKADITKTYFDVQKGSALDLSGMVSTPIPAGATGRAIVSERGTIAFENTPEKDARFKSYSLWSSRTFIHMPKAERKQYISEYAKNLRKQGYNLARIKLDYLKDFSDAPRKKEFFDIADFLLSEFKKNGIYYQIIFGTYADGRKGYKFGVHDEVKMEVILGDKVAWQRWKNSAVEFLEHVNPYTNVAWKDEPSLLCVEYYNELTNSLSRLPQLSPKLRKQVLDEFISFLKKKYKTIEDLNKAWNDTKVWYRAYQYTSFDDIAKDYIYPRNCDWAEFGWKKINKFGTFAESVVRATGYKGLVCECNTAGTYTALDYANRYADIAIVNKYFSHPSGFNRTDVYCGQKSAIGDFWVDDLVSRGFSNRPYSITEYNYCYWNQHRYEAPVLIAPYCAFQNLSVMTIHQDVIPTKKIKELGGVGTFSVGGSPIMRASELLMSCFFMRGDVKSAQHRIDMNVSNDFLKTTTAKKARNLNQIRIASLTGLRMKYDKMDILPALKNVNVKPADMDISPIGSAQLHQEAWFQEVVADKESRQFNLEKFVEVMREKGIISDDNKTDVKKGIFQTDTMQITRDVNNLWMSVVTDYSEAVAMKTPRETPLKALRVLSSTQPASVGICSLDGKKLGESARMVFVYATQEINEDTKLSFDQTFAITIGNKNIMLKNGIVKAELKVDPTKKYAVYPLSLNGVRRERLEMPVVDGVMKIAIDNSKLKYGSTTMFEIVAE